MSTRFLSTAIPYVNAPPHIGFALELIIADVLARHERRHGGDVRFLSGTDENSLKNALAAETAGLPVRDFVARGARQFEALEGAVNAGYDDFLRTGADPRHEPAVDKLWRTCASNGDIYPGYYEGLYCVGCEQFYGEAELPSGTCPEHGVPPDLVAEPNYFFRLSRYTEALTELIASGRIAVRPAHRRKEVLAFLDASLPDLSISRSVERARGWGLPVPNDPSQIVYVWFDALANYISALDYAVDGEPLRRYWREDGRISHVIGKGVVRFHAVYWPAILLSAGLPPPHEILVHGYVTAEGRKIGKSQGNAVSPFAAAGRHGADALRYYLLRHIGSHRDGDFSWERFDAAYRHELGDGLGNLVSRTLALGRRHGRPDALASTLAEGLPERIAAHLDEFAVHRALDVVWEVVAAANAYVNRTAPWRLAKTGRDGALADVLGELYATLAVIGESLQPFLPQTAPRLLRSLETSAGKPLFPRHEKGSEPI